MLEFSLFAYLCGPGSMFSEIDDDFAYLIVDYLFNLNPLNSESSFFLQMNTICLKSLYVYRSLENSKYEIGPSDCVLLCVAVGGYYNGVKYDLDQTGPGGCSLDLN